MEKLRVRNPMIVGAIGVGIIIILLIGYLSIALEKIPAGYAGVVFSLNGGTTGEVLNQGLHLLSPLENVAEYPVSTETMYLSQDEREGSESNDSFNIATKDGKPVNVDVEISYRYDIDKLDEVYTKWRGKSTSEIENTYIRARIKSITNEISSNYAVMDVYGEKRTELNRSVFKALSKVLLQDGVILETFNFTRIEPDAKTLEAIQSKVDAQQKLEEEKIETERQSVINKREIDKANSKIKIAEAQKRTNELLSKSITKEILTSEYIKKWDGKLPQYQGGNAQPILDFK